MDKYHIYDEIGIGEFSQVFKGRERKKIEYVAIKRIEKSVMNKVVNEVQVMHKLNSAHILKFFDWYETKNNLWLILEYCTGADLQSLLKQDGYLPETSVRIFGLDILAGLKYLHSLGMIHCDLKPRNFLVDEYGILKICDFKLAQKIPDRVLGDMPFEQRGTPAYMAPELFTSEGVHSFQSDLWSVGCMLYELRRGSAPFGDTDVSVGDLVERIRTVEPVSAPILATAATHGRDAEKCNANIPSLSAELADLLLWLLEKAPMNRCGWSEISAHPYWNPHKPSPPDNLPPQHVFEGLVRILERNRSAQMESASNAEYGVETTGVLVYHNADRTSSVASTTPLKLPISESTPIRPPAATKQQRHGHAEQEATPSSAGEKDYATREDRKAIALENSARQISAISSRWGESDSKQPDNNATRGAKQQHLPDTTINLSYKSFVEPSSPAKHISGAVPHSEAIQGLNAGSPAPQTARSEFTLHSNLAVTAKRSNVSVMQALLSHSSDSQVKPIVGNKTIEVVERPAFKESALSFDALPAEDLARRSTADLEFHLTQVYKSLSKVTQMAQSATPSSGVLSALNERINILGYLCSVASSAEVANVVLNTLFLGLVLKLMKSIPNYPVAPSTAAQSRAALSKTANGNLQATITANVIAAATTSRTMAATVLAMMLRYATFIQPPAIRAREDHIVGSIVALLREPGKIDPKFRRRAVAALGETVFYITAQEEDGTSAEGAGAADRWTLPSSAIEMIGRCLRDDTDEIVRHYAAKTLENVFAQGGLEFKRRFTSFDVAVRLLELSHNSKSEVLQVSCGMALSHMFVSLMTPNHLPPFANKEDAKEQASFRKGSSLSSTVSVNPDPFQAPVAVSAAKFIAKVLEKGGLAGIVDTLRDGQPRLQQAYLNIVNVVFAAPLLSAEEHTPADRTALGKNRAGEEAAITAQAVNTALRLTRSFFLKSVASIPSVVKLAEQGASSAVRGKALLTAQLLCRHTPSALVTFAERRVPQLLAKVLDPVIAMQQQRFLDNDASPPQELSYFVRTALSFVSYIREVCEEASATVAEQLQALVAGESTVSHNANSHSTPEPSPDKSAITARRKTPSTMPLKHTPSAASNLQTIPTCSLNKLRSSAELLLAAVSIASQPSLRRLILANNAQIVLNISRGLQLLSAARSAAARLEAPAEEVELALVSAEQACLMLLETLAQVDLLDQTVSAEPQSDANNHGSPPSPAAEQPLCLPSEEGWRHFVESVVLSLVPAVCAVAGHNSGDFRVVIVNSLRRLAPSAIRACMQRTGWTNSKLAMDVAVQSVAVVCGCVENMLADQAPIPQYAIRLLGDLLSLPNNLSSSVVRELSRNSTIGSLVKLLGKGGRSDRDADEEEDSTDPQLVALLSTVFGHQAGAVALVESDLATALSQALISTVYTSHAEFTHVSPELLQSLLDLLNEVLVFVFQKLVSARTAESPSKGAATKQGSDQLAEAERCRKLVGALRVVTPALMMVFAKADQFLESAAAVLNGSANKRSAARSEMDADQLQSTAAIFERLVEVASQCLGVLFDLFQEAVANQLLSRQPVTLDASIRTTTATGFSDAMTPRMVLAKMLGSPVMEWSVKIRLIRVTLATVKLAISANVLGKAKDLLQQEPLGSVLQRCAKKDGAVLNGSTVASTDQVTFVKLVLQTLELGSKL